jgi:hypothetical protein
MRNQLVYRAQGANLLQRAAHSRRETTSLPLPETPHSLLVIRNPSLDLLAAELAWMWKLPRTTQTGGKEKEKLLLLLRR